MRATLTIFLAAVPTEIAAQDTGGNQPEGPVQPIPFSHKTHVSNRVACKDCHTNPAPGEAMLIPNADRCMVCHSAVKKDSPAIQKVAEYQSRKEPIPWKRVYTLPDFVDFSHKTHLESGKATCEDCHGQVSELTVMRKLKPANMAFCVDCHRTNQAPNTCKSCHDEQ
ncbi:MAG: cytochrome c3 family protein [Candidatus Solibacter sp.]